MSSNSTTTSSSQQTTIDNEKLQQFMGKILSDFGGAASSVLVYIGDKLRLYKAMSDFGKPITSEELPNASDYEFKPSSTPCPGKGYQADFKCLGCFQPNRIYWCHD